MKLLQQSLLLLLFIISISCNSSKEENPVNIELNSSDFDIELVGDKTQFNEQSIIIKKLSLENNISITGVDWYIDNVIYSESNQSSIKFAFDLFGDINVKVIAISNFFSSDDNAKRAAKTAKYVKKPETSI